MLSRNSTPRRSKYGFLVLLLMMMTLASCGRHPSARTPRVYVDLDRLVKYHPSQGTVRLDAMEPMPAGSRTVPTGEAVVAYTGDHEAPAVTVQRRDARIEQRLALIRARLEGRERQAINREIAQIRFESSALLADQILAHRTAWLAEALQVIDEFRGRLAETDLNALAARLTADSLPAAQAARAALDASLSGRREVRTAFTRRLSEVDAVYFRRLDESRADVNSRRDARIDAARSASAYKMERILRRVDAVTGWGGDGRGPSGTREWSPSVKGGAPVPKTNTLGRTFVEEQPLKVQQATARSLCREWARMYCQLNGKQAEFVRRKGLPDWTQRVVQDMEARIP